MGTEFLVACLWVVVLVYWFWSKRPARADTVGVYRRALRVLEHATPARVVPAYRLCSPAVPLAAPPRPAVALWHKRAQLRRRRRDTISVLLGAVLVTIAAAVFTGSDIALAAQVACDVALASYISLLVRAARVSAGAGPRRRDAAVHPIAPDPGWPAVYADWPAIEEPVVLPVERQLAAPQVATYVPAHALRQADQIVVASEADESYADESYAADGYGYESYGDFDSYASLALVSAR